MNNPKIVLVLITLILLFSGDYVYSQKQNDDYKQALVQMVIGNNSAAINLFSKAITLDENLIDAYYNRGICYQKNNNIDKALADFTTVISKDPGMHGAFNNRGLIYFKESKYENAISDFSKSIELNPDYPFTYLYRSNCYLNLKSYKKALDDAIIVLSYLPNYSNAHKNAAYSCYELKKYNIALNHSNALIMQFHKNDKYYLLRARINKALEDDDASCKDYNKAVELGNIDAKIEKVDVCK